MIPLFKVFMRGEAIRKANEVLMSGYIGQGSRVEEFEKALSVFLETEYVLTVSAGTHALHLAMILSGVGEGDEVITSPMTCTATNWPILYQKAKPVWCDVDIRTGNIDADKVEELITEKTKAILCVHWAGIPCALDPLNIIGYRHNIPVIEDGAHAFGAIYRGMMIGSVSKYTMFSFQAIKHLTSVDGGLLAVRNEEDYKRGKLLRWYGIDRENSSKKDMRCEEDILEVGYKYHMNDVCATIGLENFKSTPQVLYLHRDNAGYYYEELKNVPGIDLLEVDATVEPSWWIFTMKVEDRDGFMRRMNEKGIMASRVHERNDIHTCMKRFERPLPILDEFHKKYISIPCGWWVTSENREYIAETIKEGW